MMSEMYLEQSINRNVTSTGAWDQALRKKEPILFQAVSKV